MAANDPVPHRILVADDQPDVLEALRLLLKGEGYQIDTVKSPAAVIKAIEARDFSLALIDLNYTRDTTSGQEGLDLLARLQAADPTLPVVVMTAWASVEIAVEAMRRGAKDFVTKPWDNPRLLSIVKNQLELAGAVRAYRRLEQENQILRGRGGPNLIAQSAAMRPVLEIISRGGPSDANILITGPIIKRPIIKGQALGFGVRMPARQIHPAQPSTSRMTRATSSSLRPGCKGSESTSAQACSVCGKDSAAS